MSSAVLNEETVWRAAARAIAEADGLLVSAGAGMGVDSGLPDFRGDEGFWKAYPAYAHLGLSFIELANPRWFRDDPALAWGFYGHRLNLYRATQPHDGFARLRAWGDARPAGTFVFTSNIDGQFQRAGFDPERIVECHGAIETWQCGAWRCKAGLFPAHTRPIDVDAASFRAGASLPDCPACGGVARPNVLMFGDDGWDPSRTDAQRARFDRWVSDVATAGGRLTIVECGAGSAVPTVRMVSETLVRQLGATLVRINVREPEGPRGTISIASGARVALAQIEAAWPDTSARAD